MIVHTGDAGQLTLHHTEVVGIGHVALGAKTAGVSVALQAVYRTGLADSILQLKTTRTGSALSDVVLIALRTRVGAPSALAQGSQGEPLLASSASGRVEAFFTVPRTGVTTCPIEELS